MKYFLNYLFVVSLLLVCSFSLNANRYVVEVVDEADKGINAANVSVIGNFVLSENRGRRPIRGISDDTGVFVFTERLYSRFKVDVSCAGYYPSHVYVDPVEIAEDGSKRMPNIVKTKVVLEKKKDPVEMVVGRLMQKRVPSLDQKIGYDLMVGDWIHPYGSGIEAHFSLMMHFEINASQELEEIVEIEFLNGEDGLVAFELPDRNSGNSISALKSNFHAPEGDYKSTWIWGKITSPVDGQQERKYVLKDYSPNKAYYLRINTEKDASGNIISANYGKIYGDLWSEVIGKDHVKITWGDHYINPVSGDQNIEFDPDRPIYAEGSPFLKTEVIDDGITPVWAP